MEKYYSMPLQKVLENVESSEKGLSNEQAQNRLHKYGKNALQESKRKSTFMVFLEQFKDFLVIILIVAGIHYNQCDIRNNTTYQSRAVTGKFKSTLCTLCKSIKRWTKNNCTISRNYCGRCCFFRSRRFCEC